MRIDRLELVNFRCFDRVKVSFAPGFNVMIGENGAGKTAMLEALAFGLRSFVDEMEDKPRTPRDLRDVRRRTFEEGSVVNIEPQWPVEIALSLDVDGSPVEACRSFDGKGEVGMPNGSVRSPIRLVAPRTDVHLRRLAGRKRESVRAGGAETLPVVIYLPTGRLWNIVQEPLEETFAPGSRTLAYGGCLDVRATPWSFARWMKTQELQALQEGRPSALLDAVKTAVQTAVTGCVGIGFNVRENTLLVAMESQGRLPFSMLSDGQRNMIAMVGDIAYRCAILNPHLGATAASETPGVVLIDELDLHLHPWWQRRIVEDLRRTFPRVQFFATTHSALVLSGVRPDEVIRLERNADGAVVVERSDEDPRLLTASQINKDFFGIPGLFPTELAATYRRYALLANTTHRSDDEELEVTRLYAELKAAQVEVEAPEPRDDGERGRASEAP